MKNNDNKSQSASEKLVYYGDLFIRLIAICLSLYQLYVSVVGISSTLTLRATHLMVLLVIGVVVYPLTKSVRVIKPIQLLVDGILIFLAVGANIYIMNTSASNIFTYGNISTQDIFWGFGLIIVVIEMTRRIVSPALSYTTIVVLLYAIFGHYISGAWGHRYYSFERVISFLFTTMEGIYGIPLGISAGLVILFIIFGAFLAKTGGTTFFIDLAKSLIGGQRGGPAKAAIISSGFMGTISGSPVANVVATGTFTIPLMIKTGYKPYMAGAIEAVASTGGLMVPPVMGASAFLMAEYLNMAYYKIVIIAILPAILYYLALFLASDLEARKLGLEGIPKDEIPKAGKVLAERGHLGAVLIMLFFFLALNWSPQKAIVVSLVFLILLAMMRKTTRIGLKGCLEALEEGAKGTVIIAVSTACAGIIVGCVLLTGLGTQFASFLNTLSGQSLLLALITTMVAALILGCGMPPTPVYIIMAALIIPSIIQMGVTPISAHFFVFYFSSIAGLTPPVAITSYTAASVAKDDPNKVSMVAFIYALPAFILPFMLVYSPELLLQGNTMEVIRSIVTSAIGISSIVIGLQGYLFKKISVILRIMAIVGGLSLVDSGSLTDTVGMVFMVIIVINNYLAKKKNGLTA